MIQRCKVLLLLSCLGDLAGQTMCNRAMLFEDRGKDPSALDGSSSCRRVQKSRAVDRHRKAHSEASRSCVTTPEAAKRDPVPILNTYDIMQTRRGLGCSGYSSGVLEV